MSKFKVGDKVKITSLPMCYQYDMIGLKPGATVKVIEVNHDYRKGMILVEHNHLLVLVRLSDIELVEQ